MACYDLQAVISAAKDQKIIYGGRKVSRDIANLEYTLNEVARCIQQLTPENFDKVWSDTAKSIKFDVYKIKFSPKEDVVDSIYIKLCLLDNGELFVKLGSFHLE